MTGVKTALDARDAAWTAEAELIWLCDQLQKLAECERVVFTVRETVEEQMATDPVLDRLYSIEDAILNRLDDLPAVTTTEAGRALLRAAETQIERRRDGSPNYRSNAEWLAFAAAHALAGAGDDVSADAGLIRKCARLIAMELEWQNSGDEDGNFPDRPAEYDDLVAAVTATPALTDAGNRAKLAFAVAFAQDGLPDSTFIDGLIWDAMKALALPPTALERFVSVKAAA